MKNFLHKKWFLVVISTLFVCLFVISWFSVDFGICPVYPDKCNIFADALSGLTLIFIPVLIYGFFLLKSSIGVFKSWSNFSFVFILIYWILIAITPARTHGLDFLPVTKGSVALVLAALYSFVSMLVIVFNLVKKHKRN